MVTADELEFDEWWQDFLQNNNGDKEGHPAIEQLRRNIREFPESKRTPFLDALALWSISRGSAWWIAAEALVDEGRIGQRRRVFDYLKSLNDVELNSNDLAPFLRVIASESSEEFKQFLTDYLLKRKINLTFTGVAWALWPYHRDLFRDAFVRFFTSVPSTDWSDCAIIQAFQTAREPLQLLKDPLQKTAPEIWKIFRESITNPRMTAYLDHHQQISLAEWVSG